MGIDLASYPTWKLSEATSESHGHTIRGMKLSSFRGFGFVIYRCTYSDDTAWANLLSVIKQEALDNIKKLGPGRDWLGTHLEWKVVEDPKLEGASVEEVKRRFDAWAEDVVGEYERTSTDNVRALPRFNFCVLVDEKCLANFENSKTVGNGREQSVFVVLVKAKRGVPAWVLKAQKAAAGWPRGSRVSEDGEEEIGRAGGGGGGGCPAAGLSGYLDVCIDDVSAVALQFATYRISLGARLRPAAGSL